MLDLLPKGDFGVPDPRGEIGADPIEALVELTTCERLILGDCD
ncbi:MAG TPA: hypothetical protein PKU78_06480 [Candidatus Dojkabacteria bacterium]|nr:hypothetical protein [Candidatus Dojkabacteria bacterium]